MSELHLGRMTYEELSIWFGLKPKTFATAKATTKQKKFKILKTFADYHFEGKSVIIDRIIIPEYSKALNIIEEEFPKRWGIIKDNDGQVVETLKKQRLDTCARVGTDIWYDIPEVKNQIQLRTAKNYTNAVKVKRYGHNYLDDFGSHGYSESVWMNKDCTRPLNEEENKIVSECAQLAYGPVSDKIAKIDDDMKKGNMTKEERDYLVGSLDTMDNYDYFVELVIDKLGYMPDKRTQLIDTNDFSKE